MPAPAAMPLIAVIKGNGRLRRRRKVGLYQSSRSLFSSPRASASPIGRTRPVGIIQIGTGTEGAAGSGNDQAARRRGVYAVQSVLHILPKLEAESIQHAGIVQCHDGDVADGLQSRILPCRIALIVFVLRRVCSLLLRFP